MLSTSAAAAAAHSRNPLGHAIRVALTLGSSCAVAATSEPADSSLPGSEDKPQQFEKIDVTGTATPSSPKFTAPLVDTAQSISIVPQAIMQQTAATSLQDALRTLPGITFGAGEGGLPSGDQPSIRGFDATPNIYVDGMRDIGIQTRDIFDLEQIEVVKGPDSSIAGRGAAGGSINLVSKTAHTGTSTDFSATYGTAGQYRATADTNIQLSDTVAARFNVMDLGGGVPGRDAAVRADKTGFAGTVTFGLGTPNRLTFNYYHLDDHSTPDYGVPVDLSTGTPITETMGIDRKSFYGLVDRDRRDAQLDAYSVSFVHDFSDSLNLRSQLRATNNLNNYIITSPDDAAGNTPNGLVYRLPIARNAADNGLISQTDLFGHIETDSIRHDFDAGLELSQEKLGQRGGGNYNGAFFESPAGPQGFGANGGAESCYLPGDPEYTLLQSTHDCTTLANPNPNDPWNGTVTLNPLKVYYTTLDYAPYVFDTITLSPHWKVNAGVRWDEYKTKTRAPGDPADFNAQDALNFTSYQASVMYKPADNGTVYLMTGTSSTPEDLAFGLGQDGAFPASPYYPSSTGAKPEKTRSLELGTKWNLFANRLLLSGDVFYENHTNAAIEIEPSVYDQVGKTRVRGVELSANGAITDQWNMIAGYSYVDAILVRGSDYDTGVGKQLVNTPRNTFSLWSTYQVDAAWTLGGGAYYRDRQVGYYGPPDRSIPSYWRFDAMARWQVSAAFALQANIQNLFDKAYYSKVYYQFALPMPGRTFMLTADFKL